MDPEIFHPPLIAVVNHVISHQSLSLVSPSIQVHSVDKGRTISKVIWRVKTVQKNHTSDCRPPPQKKKKFFRRGSKREKKHAEEQFNFKPRGTCKSSKADALACVSSKFYLWSHEYEPRSKWPFAPNDPSYFTMSFRISWLLCVS